MVQLDRNNVATGVVRLLGAEKIPNSNGAINGDSIAAAKWAITQAETALTATDVDELEDLLAGLLVERLRQRDTTKTR
ncbi:MAG: hypothetical protein ABSE73_02025 [Planctomycetota bacterium]